jgi:MFS superfamily sulfate permease-like transporter
LTINIPRGNAAGFRRYLQQDLVSGLMVFIGALPLCLAISLASGYPAMAGIVTAVIGGILTTLISNSELTIKGPAAGLIVIVLGCVKDFGGNGFADGIGPGDIEAYRAALAVGVVAAVLQILLGLLRAGILSEFFPKSAIHGMLSAIGVMIIAKQIPNALGASSHKQEPLELLAEIPNYALEANPAIASIGLLSLGLLALWPSIKKNLRSISVVPPQLIVLVVAVLFGYTFTLEDKYLVPVPSKMFGIFDQVTLPNFEVLKQWIAWKWVLMFFIIGSLESILSAKAVDSIDPWKRKTDMNRDLLAVGCANLCASMVGGLPMISEIVRSKANIDSGGRTRFADMWHGVFLLVFVAVLPSLLHLIPKSALAAMLIYTGFRLAQPSEFAHMYRSGRIEFLVFMTTLIVTLATDLLIGVAAGIGVMFAIQLVHGVPIKSFFTAHLDIERNSEDSVKIRVRESAVFSNWIPLKRQIESIGLVQRNNLVIDVSDAKLVDQSLIEKLHETRHDFEAEGLKFVLVGLENHRPGDHG